MRANMRTNFSDTALGNLCTTRCVAPPSSAFVAPSRVKRPPPRPPAPRSLVQTFLRVGTGRKSGNGSNSRARPARAADWKDRVDRALTRSSKIPVAMHAEPAYVPVMSPPATLMTAEDLLQTRFPDKRTELVRGVLVVREPAGSRHGLVTMNLGAELAVYAKQTGAGAVYAAETGFKLATNPDTVRAPDIAFVTRDRLPPPDATGYPALAPDLAVEVLSPGDRPGQVLAKVADWLSAGTRLVWTVDPERRVARVYRHDGSETFVTADSALDGEDVLPGFSCSLVSIL